MSVDRKITGGTVVPSSVMPAFRLSVPAWAMSVAGLSVNLMTASRMGYRQPAVSVSVCPVSPPGNSWGESHASAQAATEPQRSTVHSAGAGQNSDHIKLAGSLETVDLVNVLQAAGVCNITGRLNLRRSTEQAQIYLRQGEPIHVAMQEEGENAKSAMSSEFVLLDLLLWESGTFELQHDDLVQCRTLHRAIEALFLDAALLRDCNNFLREKGFSESCWIARTRGAASNRAESLLSTGIPADAWLQRAIYDKLSRPTRACSLIANLPGCVWIPIMYNLFSTGLVTADNWPVTEHDGGNISYGAVVRLSA